MSISPQIFFYDSNDYWGGPGGTAGGIKETTATIMFLLFKSELSGNSSVVFRNRIISNKTVLQAFTVILFS